MLEDSTVRCSAQVIDRPPVLSTPSPIDHLGEDRGWPQTLCLIEVSPNVYACNCADTIGIDPDPMTGVLGLAVFTREESANEYMRSLNGLSGAVVPKTFAECHRIASERLQLQAMFLMNGNSIMDIIFVR